MTMTNRDIKRVSRQVFASSRAIVTPFYNRKASMREMTELFAHQEDLRGEIILVSAPMGTGKTFFIDQVGKEIGVLEPERPLFVKEVTGRDVERERGTVVFFDEADTKSDWQGLTRGLSIIGEHLAGSGRIGLVLGDFVLRNPDLLRLLPEHHFLQSFEPLDRDFLQGVIRQRLAVYLDARKGEDVIDAELYDVLVPDGMARVNSFRSVLSYLEELVRSLPHNDAACQLTVDLATRYISETFDPVFWTDRQEEFLNLFLDHLAAHHPHASGLEQGYGKADLFVLGQQAAYEDWAAFQDEVIDPFGDQGLLVSRGTPALDERGHFVRWVEPYYPSLRLMLLAEA